MTDVYLAACMTYSNHASYLREWLEFHRIVGVERFFLYDNGSSDDHLEVLAPYIEEGMVSLQDWPGAGRQHAAFDHCLEAHRSEARWIAFIDVDEFLFSPTGRPVPEVLRDYEPWPGLGVNLAQFGTSGHRTRPDGLVIESYLYRSFSLLRWIKSIVDPARALRCHGAHRFVFSEGHTVDVHKRPTVGWESVERSLDVLRVNHYYTKSEAELLEKWGRPRADTGELRHELVMEDLHRMESRFKRDETILMYLPRLKRALGMEA
jgi:hypothetical protein